MFKNKVAKSHDSVASHNHEHQEWSRRSFLQALGIGCTGSILLGGSNVSASSISPLAIALNNSHNDNILILIRLSGGNDGLNTIVPTYDYDTYVNTRPNIYHKENSLIKLNDDFSIPDYMQRLESMWGDGQMKIVHGVGYDSQNLSHFKSSDIMATSQTNGGVLDKGWMGRYFNETNQDFLFNPPEKPLAIQIGSVGNLIFNYEDQQFAFLVSNPNQLEQIAENGTQFSLENLNVTCKSGQQQEFLRSLSNSTFKYSKVISDAYKAKVNTVEYDDNNISKQFSIIARLIKGNLGTKVYMVTLGGFDTHANQPERHAKLMGELSSAVANFYKDIKETGHDEKVLGMTFSEFGRRVNENGSNGTDHGAASPTMFFGTGLNGNGFVGNHPDLGDLDSHGNLKNSIDFRQLYASVLSQWLCIDEAVVSTAISGSYDSVGLGFSCRHSEDPTNEEEPVVIEEPKPDENSETPELDVEEPKKFGHRAFNDAIHGPSIAIDIDKAMHVDIVLYTILGQRVGTIKNKFMAEGSHTIRVKDISSSEITPGEYIYRVSTMQGVSSKIIMIN